MLLISYLVKGPNPRNPFLEMDSCSMYTLMAFFLNSPQKILIITNANMVEKKIIKIIGVLGLNIETSLYPIHINVETNKMVIKASRNACFWNFDSII